MKVLKCVTAVLVSLLLNLPDVHSSHNHDPSSVDAQHESAADTTNDNRHTDVANAEDEVHRDLQWKYEEPAWWGRVGIDFAQVVNLQQCTRKRLPPVDGATCSKKAKTCFFGNQECPAGDLYPSLQCFCDGNGKAKGRWICTTVACPPLPESFVSAPTAVPPPPAPITPAPTIGIADCDINRNSNIPYIDNIPNNCPWTQWYDRDNTPGFGDYELFFHWAWTGFYVCPGRAFPLSIECQAFRHLHCPPPGLIPVPADAHDTGEVISCNRCEGFYCDNADQPDNRCDYDYRVRFQCPCKTPAPVIPPPPTSPPTPAPVRPPPTQAPTIGTISGTVREDDCHNIPNACPLTDWYNLDGPGGYGDYEQPSVWATRGLDVCPDGASPLSIECQAFRHVTASAGLIPVPADAHDTGEVIECNRCDGFYCENPSQPDGRCDYDYRVRFQCPCGVNAVNITVIDPTPAPVTTPTPAPTIGTISGTVREDVCDNFASMCPWTGWYNYDSPHGSGDYEGLSGYAAKGIVVCPGGASPLSVECHAIHELSPTGALTAITPVNAGHTGEVITCDRCQGFYCENSAQPDGRCHYDYAIRFQCPC